MKKHNSAGSSILFILLLLFASAQAQLTPTVTPVCHSNDGGVVFSGLTGVNTYQLNNTTTGQYYTQSSPTFTGLPAGSYYAYAYGSDSGYATFSIPNTVTLSTSVTNTTCPANAGVSTVTAAGGSGVYSYLWNTTATTASISGLPGGVYTVTVTESGGCSAIISDTILAPSSLFVTIAETGGLCNPVLTASATGNTGSVSYVWSNSAHGASISNLSAYTNYSVIGTDANGCTASQQAYIGSTTLYLDSGLSVVNPGCSGSLGSITIHMQTGTAPFAFHWSVPGTDSILTGLTAGSYNVTVTDANGCTATNTYNLNVNSISIYLYATSPPTCGNSDGTLTAYTYGGTGSYTYLWSPISSTGSSISSIGAGTYSVTASDGNGCSASATKVVQGVSGYTVGATSTPTACDTSLYTGTATAYVTGTGGTPPYAFTWYQNSYYGLGGVIGTTQTITGLFYNEFVSVAVTDANGCVPQNVISDSIFIQLDPSCYDHITGYVYNDLNSNCTFDAGETPVSQANVIATNSTGQTFYATPDSSGFYDIQVLAGTYTVAVNLYNNSNCTLSSCSNSYTATFATIGLVQSGDDFAVGNGNAAFDLGVHMGYQGSAPGQTRQYWVYYYNYGQTSVSSGVLTFVHDPNITLSSTTPNYTSYNATTHTITWNITNNLNPMQGLDAQHQVIMYFDIPQSLALGTLLTAHADISPTAGDCDLSDNSQDLTDLVSGSHDPNEKEVSPTGNLLASDSVLTYTIRFQNDGNAPASRIVITDTLSANVDPATVVPGAATFMPYKFTVTGKGILTFTFDGINLPDSVHDVDHSKGFVVYTVHTKPNLPLYSQVNNTASIFFDQNPAVVTNTTTSLRSDFPTGISNLNSGTMNVSIVPNPVHDISLVTIKGATGIVSFELSDVTGQKVFETRTTATTIDLNGELFAPGIYMYKAIDAAGSIRTGKVSITH